MCLYVHHPPMPLTALLPDCSATNCCLPLPLWLLPRFVIAINKQQNFQVFLFLVHKLRSLNLFPWQVR